MENQLGSRLLNRTTRSLKLTTEGEAFYEKAQFLLAELEETFQDLSGVSQQAKGKLRIEMPTAIAPLCSPNYLNFNDNTLKSSWF